MKRNVDRKDTNKSSRIGCKVLNPVGHKTYKHTFNILPDDILMKILCIAIDWNSDKGRFLLKMPTTGIKSKLLYPKRCGVKMFKLVNNRFCKFLKSVDRFFNIHLKQHFSSLCDKFQLRYLIVTTGAHNGVQIKNTRDCDGDDNGCSTFKFEVEVEVETDRRSRDTQSDNKHLGQIDTNHIQSGDIETLCLFVKHSNLECFKRLLYAILKNSHTEDIVALFLFSIRNAKFETIKFFSECQYLKDIRWTDVDYKQEKIQCGSSALLRLDDPRIFKLIQCTTILHPYNESIDCLRRYLVTCPVFVKDPLLTSATFGDIIEEINANVQNSRFYKTWNETLRTLIKYQKHTFIVQFLNLVQIDETDFITLLCFISKHFQCTLTFELFLEHARASRFQLDLTVFRHFRDDNQIEYTNMLWMYFKSNHPSVQIYIKSDEAFIKDLFGGSDVKCILCFQTHFPELFKEIIFDDTTFSKIIKKCNGYKKNSYKKVLLISEQFQHTTSHFLIDRKMDSMVKQYLTPSIDNIDSLDIFKNQLKFFGNLYLTNPYFTIYQFCTSICNHLTKTHLNVFVTTIGQIFNLSAGPRIVPALSNCLNLDDVEKLEIMWNLVDRSENDSKLAMFHAKNSCKYYPINCVQFLSKVNYK